METDERVEKTKTSFFHTSLQNAAAFRTVPTGSAAVNPQTTKPDRSFATETGHFDLLPTRGARILPRSTNPLTYRHTTKIIGPSVSQRFE